MITQCIDYKPPVQKLSSQNSQINKGSFYRNGYVHNSRISTMCNLCLCRYPQSIHWQCLHLWPERTSQRLNLCNERMVGYRQLILLQSQLSHHVLTHIPAWTGKACAKFFQSNGHDLHFELPFRDSWVMEWWTVHWGRHRFTASLHCPVVLETASELLQSKTVSVDESNQVWQGCREIKEESFKLNQKVVCGVGTMYQ